MHTVDLSEPAIETSVANMDRNRHRPEVAACEHTTEGAGVAVVTSRRVTSPVDSPGR